MMEVQTREFGTLQVEERHIYSFPNGVYGLEEHKQFVLIQPDRTLPFAYLQATDEATVSLLVADPFAFQPNYEFELPQAEVETLQQVTPEDLSVWVTVSMTKGLQEATMNLLAPLVLNQRRGFGRQVVLHDSRYGTRVPLFRQPKGDE